MGKIDYERLKRHLSMPREFTLKDEVLGEDLVLELKPMTTKQLSMLFYLAPKMKGQTMDNLGQEEFTMLIGIIKDMIKNSYPDWSDDVLDNFVVTNFEKLGEVLSLMVPEKMSAK